MQSLTQICQFLEEFAPTRLAEEWDNVGLLAGDMELEIHRVMTCLTITPESAAEAIEKQAELIVSHHPLPFRSIKKITTAKTPTRLLWNLIRNGVSIYSPHTGFDSAQHGINYSVCERLNLDNIRPLIPKVDESKDLGTGRLGELASEMSLANLLNVLKSLYGIEQLRLVGDLNRNVRSIASACGSGASFLPNAVAAGCDTLITGEADFHSCLEAKAQGLSLILLGHHTSERFAVEMLAKKLSEQFNDLEIWASNQESDPILWY